MGNFTDAQQPWTTAMIWMPLPPESDSQEGSGTGQIWVTSSRLILSFGVSQGCDLRHHVMDGVLDAMTAA
jgi:hypothetical protein